MSEIEKAIEYLLQISSSHNEIHIETILEALDLDILNLVENNRLLENGSKQLCEEIKRLIQEKDTLIKALRYINAQYEFDFTDEELKEKAFSSRDKFIYTRVIETLEEIDI